MQYSIILRRESMLLLSVNLTIQLTCEYMTAWLLSKLALYCLFISNARGTPRQDVPGQVYRDAAMFDDVFDRQGRLLTGRNTPKIISPLNSLEYNRYVHVIYHFAARQILWCTYCTPCTVSIYSVVWNASSAHILFIVLVLFTIFVLRCFSVDYFFAFFPASMIHTVNSYSSITWHSGITSSPSDC